MKEACAYFNLEMNVSCPYCGHEIDLEEEGYRKTWLSFFKSWVSNDGSRIDAIKEKEQCSNCDSYFLVTEISR